MRKPILAGNWKMNGTNPELPRFFESLVQNLPANWSEDVEVIFALPYTLLQQANVLCKSSPITIASQNINQYESGAYTGEISAAMLKDIGVTTTLIGHSERRQYYAETDESVSEKVRVCLEQGIRPIACVGETKDERESGVTEDVVARQVTAILAGVKDLANLVIAYEPVWAIGTGLTASDEQANQVHSFIRDLVAKKFNDEQAQNLRILYGGSAKPANIDGLLKQEHIDGGLVGGASLKADDFSRMINAAVELYGR